MNLIEKRGNDEKETYGRVLAPFAGCVHLEGRLRNGPRRKSTERARAPDSEDF